MAGKHRNVSKFLIKRIPSIEANRGLIGSTEIDCNILHLAKTESSIVRMLAWIVIEVELIKSDSDDLIIALDKLISFQVGPN